MVREISYVSGVRHCVSLSAAVGCKWGKETTEVAWSNQPLILYHGTDDVSAVNIMKAISPYRHGINLSRCKSNADFGPGFYTTTSLYQAKDWANKRIDDKRKTSFRAGLFQPITLARATVLGFEVDRDELSKIDHLIFPQEDKHYWDFVKHCRDQIGPHRPTGNYDVVTGPLSNWPHPITFNNCDQVSFHTPRGLMVLPTPTIEAQMTFTNPFFILP